MDNAQLTEYVVGERARGVPDEAIRQALAVSGWSLDAIELAMGRPVATSPAPTTDAIFTPAQSEALTLTPSTLPGAEIVETAAAVPKPLKIAAFLTWGLAASLAGMAIIKSVFLFLLALGMQERQLVIPELLASSALAQQPFMLAAIAVMLVWLGRGVWQGVKKLTILALCISLAAAGTWVGTQWLLAADFAKLVGTESVPLKSLVAAPVSPIQYVLSPVILVAVAAVFALVLALSFTDSEHKPASWKLKIMLTLISVVILGPVLGLTTMVSIWSLDKDLGATTVSAQVQFALHKLPANSEFMPASRWQIPKSLSTEPQPAAEFSVIPKIDQAASVSAQRLIVVREYPSSNTPLVKILQLDPATETGLAKRVELSGGKNAMSTEKPFGQGKLVALAFISSDGVIIRMTSTKAVLPDLIKLANELN